LPWVRYRGWRLIEETLEGARYRVRLRFDSSLEARQFALAFGPDLEVVEPVALREDVVAAAAAVIAAYSRAAT